MDLTALPKAELHVHVEGTLEPELVFALARRHGLTLPWADPDELRAGYEFSDLASFLKLYYDCMTVLRQGQDFCDLALAYLERAARDGVRRAEIFFDPQVHLDHGVPLAEQLAGLTDALAEAGRRWGIEGGYIMCFLRDLGPRSAERLWRLAEPWADRLLGVGLDSAEVGFPPEPFGPVFDQARRAGLHAVAHGGEEGPPSYVWGALDRLGAERVDHGLRCLEDPALVDRLVAERIPLTGCPFSNVRLRTVADLASHPLGRMLELGLQVCVNSDDPAYFGGYVGDNLEAVRQALGLSDRAVAQLCRNSILGSFAEPARRAQWLDELDQVSATAVTADPV
ncbi:MAG: adenosine deaminase [Propionibacteriaceae bacterium]|jgi:adenosine deaminase|nr:adenosine deaminase [Propionibacteriaceae bacterium]